MMEVKPDARILDATASYRSIWDMKNSDKILWIDIETDLDLQPDRIMDCTHTDFSDKRFHTIFFDPPHKYGEKKNQGVFSTPSRKKQKERWGDTGCYYGFDKFKTKSELLEFIRLSQLEFHRILSDDGILWVKWCEHATKLDVVISIFNNWNKTLCFETAYQGQVKGKRTFWVAFTKKDSAWQSDLGEHQS